MQSIKELQHQRNLWLRKKKKRKKERKREVLRVKTVLGLKTQHPSRSQNTSSL